jgi:tricorn protease
MTHGYYRWPTINGNQIVFGCEDDLWSVSLSGGFATRLSADLGHISCPQLSPDGQWIAYIGSDQGHQEVYIMPAKGGVPTRLTYFGAAVTRVSGWKPDSSAVICSSSHRQILRRMVELFAVPIDGSEPESLKYGMAHHISWQAEGAGTVIGRHTWDPARWKRYRGGTAGVLWLDRTGNGQFEPFLRNINGNLATPLWLGERIWFLSDHEGIGNIYSVNLDGQDLKRHTHHDDFYVRFPHSDGQNLVYQAGGEIWKLSLSGGAAEKIEIDWRSPQVQRNRKFASPTKYLNAYQLHPQGHSLGLISRGKAFSMPLWAGAPQQHGEREGTRYRVAQYLNDNQRMVLVGDSSGEEQVEVHWIDGSQAPVVVDDLSLGRPEHVQVSPTTNQVAVVNHRRQLLLVDLDSLTTRVLDETDQHQGIGSPAWSPDGRWLAYAYTKAPQTSIIKLCHLETGSLHEATRPVLEDFSPSFDPDGKYLYFISTREFNPSYDEMHFALGFPYGTRPYLLTLRKDLRSPFEPDAEMLIDKKDTQADSDKTSENKAEIKVKPVEIDLDGLADRIVAFPVKDGRYRKVLGLPDKVLYITYPVHGSLDQNWSESVKIRGTLRVFNLKTREEEVFMEGVNSFYLSNDSKSLLVRVDNKLRVLSANEKPSEKTLADSKPGKKSGWLDLERIKLSVVPAQEWQQMYHDAWRRMRDHFWSENMSEVDWDEVRQRYLPLLEKVACRSEFSDLLWEVQGELATSHAYEMGGDYRNEPQYSQGFLGADFAWDASAEGYRITHIVHGDHWDAKRGGPLAKPGINARVGDVITAINGEKLSATFSPEQALINQSKSDVLVSFGGDTPRTVQVRALDSDTLARYRDWVEKNRAFVHENSQGQVGYVHIPDMGPFGFAEFHRYYLSECNYPALLVDVRFNGGGHVSQLLLDKLSRKRLGYDLPRWGRPEPFPAYSVLGPMLALTDENAGSDGDIFSHSFKMLKLGPLVGKRTWGGVIGIDSQGKLVDGSLTTQPEYSFWFNDVGWNVENYGTDPDIEVEYAPHDYFAGVDPQLTTALEKLNQMLVANPAEVPDLSKRPSLKRQPLPPIAE